MPSKCECARRKAAPKAFVVNTYACSAENVTLNNAAKLNRLNEMQAEKKSCVRAAVIYCAVCECVYSYAHKCERYIYKSEYIACVNVCVRTESWVWCC